MRRSIPVRLQTLIALAMVLATAIPVSSALGQTGGTGPARIEIDSPTAGTTVSMGNQVLVGGWAADPAGPGTGVDEVRVYLDGQMDSGGTLLGQATTGVSRPDVAAALGNPALATSGYNYLWTPSNLSGGPHTLYVYARSGTSGAWSFKPVAITAPAQPTPMPTPVGGQWGPGPGYGPDYGYGPGPGYGYGPGAGYPPDWDYRAPGMGYPPYPPIPQYPYQGYPPVYPIPPNDRVCILIYPPPPGC